MRISIGNSRKDKRWKVVDYTWDDLCKRLSTTLRTSETVNEYKAMNTADKSAAKDHGGFVGGVVRDGRRVKGNIDSRSIVTLDADYAREGVWENIEMLFDYAICCYSTHSHLPKAPRLRIIIPLDREVPPDEYEPIARRLAADIGIDMFDVTTYETSRLMYWPSTPRDGEYIFKRQDGEFISADDILNRYEDWKDAASWPLGSTEQSVRVKQAKAQGEPTQKKGIVGQFCRTYDVPTAIDTFLSDIYAPCQEPNRYTYIPGSTSAGVVLYQDGAFAYSHHSTDPAGGNLCNAFDLVRLHKFGDLDYKIDRDTPINQRPSYKAMATFATSDDLVKQTMVSEGMEKAKEAFKDTPRDDTAGADIDWAKDLDVNDKGEIRATIDNIVLILENDENIRGRLAVNTFKGIPCIIADVPWRKCKDIYNGEQWDDDDSYALAHYIETTYGVYNQGKMTAALSVVMNKHSFHPVRNYLNKLEWDGVNRGEYLFINYFGAEDNLYTRTVTKKWLTAAVARVMNPGCKFDNLVVLVGAQGIGKSYLGSMLGKGWFSDTFTTVQGKDAYEQLKGCWIIEIAELSVMKKAEVESVKMFISKQEDNYRGAYKEFPKVNKRQCVFYGTTNDDTFLRDKTGNRRFWPIATDKDKASCSVFDLKDDDINQLWAEAVNWYKSGESLYLSQEVTALAVEEQARFMTLDPRQGMVEDYLDKLLPTDWNELSKQRRREFIQGVNFADSMVGTVKRIEISVPEMAYELFGEDVLQPWQAKEYHGILLACEGWRKLTKRKRTIYGLQYVYVRDNRSGGEHG